MLSLNNGEAFSEFTNIKTAHPYFLGRVGWEFPYFAFEALSKPFTAILHIPLDEETHVSNISKSLCMDLLI